LQITERNGRLLALQDRWDGLRRAKQAFAEEDYEAAIKTGVVCRKRRMIGSGNNAKSPSTRSIRRDRPLLQTITRPERGGAGIP